VGIVNHSCCESRVGSIDIDPFLLLRFWIAQAQLNKLTRCRVLPEIAPRCTAADGQPIECLSCSVIVRLSVMIKVAADFEYRPEERSQGRSTGGDDSHVELEAVKT